MSDANNVQLLKFSTLSQQIQNVDPNRFEKYKTLMPFGVRFLDDCLRGIRTDDLVVFGARTGQGKTQLALGIATSAAKMGKKVLFFALEATDNEMGMRHKFKAVCGDLKSIYGFSDYLDWSNGVQNENIVYTPEPWTENIYVVGRGANFGMEELEQYVKFFSSSIDLIIIDHLHYLDLNGQNENEATKKAVKLIRTLNLDINRGCVLLSHIRKRNSKEPNGLPYIDDFHGSSEISKMATQVFSFESGTFPAMVFTDSYQNLKTEVPLKATMFRICKSRGDSSRAQYIGSVLWNHEFKRYADKYKLFDFDEFTGKFSELPKRDYPAWVIQND